MNQAKKLATALRGTLAALDIAYEFDGDVFGVHHNNTQDAMDSARTALAEFDASPQWDQSPPALPAERLKYITRQELHQERKVVWNLINELIAAGYVINTVDDGEELVKVKNDPVKVLDAVFAVDEAHINIQSGNTGARLGSIFIVLGNSAEEVMSDWSWTTNPEGEKFTAFVNAFEPEKYLR